MNLIPISIILYFEPSKLKHVSGRESPRDIQNGWFI